MQGRLTYEDLPLVYQKLSEDLPVEATEHVPASVSKKGYDTTGYAYQFCVNRLNEVLFGHWRAIPDLLPAENGKTRNGKTMYRKLIHMTIEIGNWIFEDGKNHFEVLIQVDGYGGHESLEESSAYKGAYTNAFKKVAAMLGVGKKAFEGLLDEDYQSHQEDLKEQERAAKQNKPTVQKENKSSTLVQSASPEPTETPDQKKIKQLRELLAVAHKKELSDEQLKVIMISRTRKMSSKDLTLEEINNLLKFLKDNTNDVLKKMAAA